MINIKTYSNQGFTIYSELWKRVADESKYWKKEKTIEFVERIRKVQEEVEAVLEKYGRRWENKQIKILRCRKVKEVKENVEYRKSDIPRTISKEVNRNL